jgi:hypothetical protein
MTLFRDMTDVEIGLLMLAHYRGEKIQGTVRSGGDDTNWLAWAECHNPVWDRDTAYRVKPKARNLTHDIHVYRQPDGGVVVEDGHWGNPNCFANITHTYTITDGRVTACDTIIHD